MAACTKLNISKRYVCLNDLKHKIKIKKRSIKPASLKEIDYEEVFEDLIEAWAAIETNSGYSSFNQVGTNDSGFTHKFYIRYSSECLITSENWIEYGCDSYDIVNVENLDEGNNFFLIRAIKKGDSSVNANKA